MTKKSFLLTGAFLLGIFGGAEAPTSYAAQVSPSPEIQVDHSGTTTGASVTVLTAGTSVLGYRTNCFLQNTSIRPMYYSFVGVASATTKLLNAGGIMRCADGQGVSTQALTLFGTNADTYLLTESFPAPQ